MEHVWFYCSLVVVYLDPAIASNYKLTSVYYGNQGWAMNELEHLSSWTGKHSTTVLLFTDWCNGSMTNLFNIQLSNIWNNRSIPIITWEPILCNHVNQPGIMKLVSINVYDSYIDSFANKLKTWLAGNDGIYGNNDDRRAFLRLGTRVNRKTLSQTLFL